MTLRLVYCLVCDRFLLVREMRCPHCGSTSGALA